MTDFSEVVRAARRSAGLSVEQLAVAAGVSSSTVRVIEAGKPVGAARLDRVLARLGYRLTAVEAAQGQDGGAP